VTSQRKWQVGSAPWFFVHSFEQYKDSRGLMQAGSGANASEKSSKNHS